MLAAGLTAPLLNFKSLSTPRAEAYPDRDLFKSVLQQRIISRNYSDSGSSTSTLNRATPKLRQARPVANSSPLLNRTNSYCRAAASSSQATDQSQESSGNKSTNSDASSPITGKRSVQTDSRNKAARLAAGNAALANPEPLPNTEMPPALKGLIDFLNQQPNQALKVPGTRIQELETFLLQAGLPAAQVESIIGSPNFQEQGLTAQAVQSAWQNAVKDSLQQALTTNDALNLGNYGSKTVQEAAQLVSLQNLTKQEDYQNLWQNLTLPANSLGALRLELQKLGVPTETLADLTQQNFPQGIPLKQVWQYLQQATPATAANEVAKPAAAANSLALQTGAKDLAAWRQLLVQAGMEPELAETLTEVSTPASREELRASLLQIAPPSTPSSEQSAPKPLFLPANANVRLRQIPWLQQADPSQSQGQGQGQGQGNANGNLAENFGSSLKFQEVTLPGTASGTPNLHNFLALLTGSGSPETAQATATGPSGNQPQAVNAYLTPEAKEAIWSQMQSGVLGNLRPGENQITLTLNPPDLGKLNLTVNLKGTSVEVTAVASHSAVAEAAATGVQQLAQALTQQGLTLTQFNFHHQDEAPQPQLTFSQNSGNSGEQQQQTGKKESDRWDKPATPRRRWQGGIDCFA